MLIRRLVVGHRQFNKSNLFIIINRYSTQNVNRTDWKPSYYHNCGKEPLRYLTIGQQLEIAANRYDDRLALISCHENTRITFQETLNEADKLAAGLLKIGNKPGDRVGIWCPNTVSWYLTMMATARAGLVLVAINPAYQKPEIEYCIKKVGLKTIIMPTEFRTQNYYGMLTELCPEIKTCEPGKLNSNNLPSLSSIVLMGNEDQPGAFNINELSSIATIDDVNRIKYNQQYIQPDSGCNIQFTSGTTGQPKAALASHYNYVNNGYYIGLRNELSLAHHKICVQVPLFHAYGVVITVLAALCHGATMVLPSASYNPEASLRSIVNEECTVIHGTPTMYVDLVAKQKELNLPLKSAKIAVTGGAACSPKLFMDIKSTFGLEKVKTVFGLTEVSAVCSQSLYEETDDKILHTIGYIQDHLEIKVINKNGEIVPMGQPGELCVRGYSTIMGYYNDPEKTKELIGDDKWLKTGDQFVLHEDGYGQIVGRLKEIIIRGGENLFPKEIEDFLNTYPNILENHVIGVPDERMGEELCAYIRLNDPSATTEEDIRNYCKGKIAHFKVPRYMIFVTEFPKTTSGKVQKYKLRQEWERQQENKMEYASNP